MAALSQAQFDILTFTVERAFNKHRQFAPCELTVEDIFEAFVYPEDVDMCRKAEKLWGARIRYSNERINLQQPTQYFSKPLPVSIQMTPSVGLPEYALAVSKLEGGAFQDKVSHEVDRFAELYRDYNLIVAVLTELNEICASPSQMAFLWPTVRDLTAMAKEADEKVETLLKALDKRTSSVMPRVSMGLRDACKATGTTMTVLKMLGDPSPANQPVNIIPGQWTSIRVVLDPNMSAMLK